MSATILLGYLVIAKAVLLFAIVVRVDTMAGLATGFWADADELTAQWAMDRRFEPAMGEDERADKRAGALADNLKKWLAGRTPKE